MGRIDIKDGWLGNPGTKRRFDGKSSNHHIEDFFQPYLITQEDVYHFHQQEDNSEGV